MVNFFEILYYSSIIVILAHCCDEHCCNLCYNRMLTPKFTVRSPNAPKFTVRSPNAKVSVEFLPQYPTCVTGLTVPCFLDANYSSTIHIKVYYKTLTLRNAWAGTEGGVGGVIV